MGMKKNDSVSVPRRGGAVFSAFELVCSRPGITRREASEALSLSITTVSSAADALIDAGLVAARPGVSTGGRRPETLFPASRPILTIDLSADRARAYLSDLSGNESSFFVESSIPSPGDASAAVRALAERASNERASVGDVSFSAVAVLLPTPDPARIADPGAAFRDGEMKAAIREAAGRCPVFFLNRDAVAASAAMRKSGVRGSVFFCTAGPDGIAAAVSRNRSLGTVSRLRAPSSGDAARALLSCRDGKEAGRLIAGTIRNAVAALSPGAVLIELSDGRFGDEVGRTVRQELGIRPEPDVFLVFRDPPEVRKTALGVIRRKLVEAAAR